MSVYLDDLRQDLPRPHHRRCPFCGAETERHIVSDLTLERCPRGCAVYGWVETSDLTPKYRAELRREPWWHARAEGA